MLTEEQAKAVREWWAAVNEFPEVLYLTALQFGGREIALHTPVALPRHTQLVIKMMVPATGQRTEYHFNPWLETEKLMALASPPAPDPPAA